MDPVLQHLGDVTIQRLEKPKAKQDLPVTESEAQEPLEEDVPGEANEGLKRNLEDPAEVVPKKLRIGSSEISITEKSRATPSLPHPSQLPSDEELSDYESESDFDYEGEDSETASIKKELPSILKESPIETDSSSFLDLVDNSFLDNKAPPITIKTESDSGDADDYEYDIKEKLKEMGEISFETVKKGEKPKKVETVNENEVTVTPAKKSTDEEGLDRKGPLSSSMLRRNIREVMDEAKLDESTLAAQRQEMERLQRVQEQQRIIREVQRQVAQEKMQNKVLSLLQGGNLSKPGTSGARIGNTVLVKLPNGETKPMTKIGKRPFELLKVQKSPSCPLRPPKSLLSPVRPPAQGPMMQPAQGQLTPSVSIAPVMKRPMQLSRPPSDSDSESEEFKYQKMLSKARVKEAPNVAATIDLSSDDDCVVVSETEGDTGGDEMVEDPANSGMHTNDEFNQPDEQGRVVINIGHPDGEPDIYVAPQIARIIKPHQIGGVRFLYDNVVESVNRFQNSTGFGCILAHSMGLGKTLQVVCFSDIFLRHTPAKTILCIMPINTLQNWLAEFNMWLPTEEDANRSPLHSYGEVRSRNFNLHVLNDSHKTLVARSKVIQAWRNDGGVLLIGYEQYRLLSLRKQPKSRRKASLIEPEDEDKNKLIFDDIHSALVMPGPDLVICDEGHRIKNSHASISQALKQMRTKRRVVLTGYPLQNNLMEYWCMVDFVRPNYLGSKTEFCNMFERPIQNGQCIDSTEADIKLMRYRAHVLHSLLVGFVQRRSHEVLQTALPQKEEYVLLLRMSSFQRKLYNTFMNEVVRVQAVPNPLKAFAVCCKIWNHPDVLYHFLKKRAGGEAVDIDLEEVSSNSTTDSSGKLKKHTRKAATPKGRKGTKPAASVTPYNSASISDSDANQSKPFPSVGQNSNSLDAPFSPSSDMMDNSFNTQNFNKQLKPTCFPQAATSFAENRKLFSQSSSFIQGDEKFSQNANTFPQQNFWRSKDNGEPYENFKRSFPQSNDMICDNAQMPQWIKKEEDSKSNLISSIKAEDSKPKINIISDIKIGGSFSNQLGKPLDHKKINIISDIKLDVKKEESNDEKLVPRFPFDIKSEVKSSLHNFSFPPRTETRTDDDDVKIISDMPPPARVKEDAQDGIPYDWAIELLRDYVPGCIENSGKMEVLFCIITESIALGDRLLLFSQSLITLDLVEQFLQTNEVPGETEKWCKNVNYYRLDGSTSALEREKLINEFNSNPKIHLFLVSTRAGSLGINLVGANRVVVLDASWNPCHDTQAVCRVYRYGQRKPCFVYRLVMDHCLEKKIYDRQINKQGMSDRVVDECNPDAHLTMKDVSTLCFDDSEEGEEKDWSHVKDRYIDIVLQKVLELYGNRLNKPPFQHESLLVDRKDKQLSQQEKRFAKKSYEREKQAARQPAYGMAAAGRSHRPIASVRPMQQGGERSTRWIPAEHWQRQGMTAQEMTLPLDVVIPTNQPDKSNIVLKAGQKVLVLKSPKGVYMQLENGKIVAIKTAIKVRGKAEDEVEKAMKPTFPPILKPPPGLPLMPPKRMVRPFSPGVAKLNMRSVRQAVPNLVNRMQTASRKIQMAKTRPYQMGEELAQTANQLKLEEKLLLGRNEELPRGKSGPRNNALSQEIAQRLLSEEITMERYSPKAEKKFQSRNEPPSNSSNAELQKLRSRSPSSTIQQLEQSTSAIISQTSKRIHDINDITNSFQEDEKLQSSSETSSLAPIDSDHLQDLDTTDEVEDLDSHYSEEPSNHAPTTSTSADLPIPPESIKTDIPNQDYNYNGYYGYNMQPYPPPPPPQGYPNYPPQPAPYDYNYPPPPPSQQPQYSYPMYPSVYPPQPQYPPPPQAPPYDYGPPPQQPPPPMYSGYHSPYPQQYPQPPAPPPNNPYTPVQQQPPTYPEYQYNTAAPQQNPQNAAPYFPNS
uniref:Helicase ARIP4 n=1 Tax=Photinus pyralis TaxID=7054 RepID=A0A1Y1K1V6_PHOPY